MKHLICNLALILALVANCSWVTAADKNPDDEVDAAPKKKAKGPIPGALMDHGPFVTASISNVMAESARGDWPNSKTTANFAYKGLAIRLNAPEPAAMCFDTDLMRMAFGWTGPYLNMEDTMLGQLRGTVNPSVGGSLKFMSGMKPGWAADGDWKDDRKFPYGPLDKKRAHYSGLYLHGNDVVLSYTVGKTPVLELPGYAGAGKGFAFTRTICIEKSDVKLSVLLCEVADGKDSGAKGSAELLRSGLEGATLTEVAVQGAPDGAKLSTEKGRIELSIPPVAKPTTFRILIWNGAKADAEQFAATLKAADPKLPDVPAMTKGGAPRWDKAITTQLDLGKDSGAYVIDTLTLPNDNPWKAWMRVTGFDFFPDGKIALCTICGDVWTVTGMPVDNKPATLTWKRIATGMFEPMGLRILGGKIYVLGRDQITRLNDLNGDGEIDFYENFNNDRVISPNYHAFAFDLETDSAGNFFYAVCGHRVAFPLPDHACMIKVSADGSHMENYADGIRSPNGLGMGPGDFLTYGDNQGNWMPSSKITRCLKGGFYGYKTHWAAAERSKRADFDPPLFWLPMNMDNSCGGQAWVPDDRWGPYKNQMIHLSYGKSALFICALEEVNGVYQGGASKVPVSFASGAMRARFSALDGQLYVGGTRGWQTSGTKDGGLQRVRYTGAASFYPTKLAVKKNGMEITFPVKLDPESVKDLENFGVEQWNYKYSMAYGSPEFSVETPDKKAHDTVVVKSAKLLADGQTVFLELAGIRPVMQMAIKVKLNAADGKAFSQQIYNTINTMPK